jgi:preprotein translocase subunit SecD
MKLARLCLIAMLAPPTLALPALAQAQPDLAFYGAHPCAAGTAGAQVEPAGGETICLDPKPLFGGTAITAVSRDVDAVSDQETAIVTLGETASTLLYAYTYTNPGQRMGVTLDGALVSAPMITAPIRSGQLTVYGLSHAQIVALVARFAAKTP